MLQQIKINGGMYDHSKIRIRFSGSYPVSDMVQNYITELNYSEKMNGANNVYGLQLSPLESTTGTYQCEFGFTILKEGWDLFMLNLPSGWTNLRFDVTITFLNGFAPPSVTIIPTVRIIDDGLSSSQGGKEIDQKITTIVSGVMVQNGKTMIPLDQDLVLT